MHGAELESLRPWQGSGELEALLAPFPEAKDLDRLPGTCGAPAGLAVLYDPLRLHCGERVGRGDLRHGDGADAGGVDDECWCSSVWHCLPHPRAGTLAPAGFLDTSKPAVQTGDAHIDVSQSAGDGRRDLDVNRPIDGLLIRLAE